MQTDDRVATENGRPSRARGPLIGIAAAVAVLIAGAVFLLTNDDPPVATPALNATDIRDVEDSSEEPVLLPGAYFVDTDGDPTSPLRGNFVIEGDGWTSVGAGARKVSGDDYVSLLVEEVLEVQTSVCEMSGRAPVVAGATAAELGNQFAAFGFIVREALTAISAFGHDGRHLLVEVPEGCAESTFPTWFGYVFPGRYYQADGQIVEYWFLDVEGDPVMVEASWFPDSPEEDVAELRALIDSLVITP